MTACPTNTPGRIIFRSLFRSLLRGLLPILSRATITGLDRFPRQGPLIVVGNHTGAMEVVLMGAYAPRAMEFMGAVEIPWSGWMGSIIDLYGLIPLHRGSTSPGSMRLGIDVLRRGGMLGIFPEGGFWEPGRQKAQTGAAWLSYMAQTPILPIGFGDTRGKMAEILRLEHPSLEMHVGKVLPPVRLERSMSKKEVLQRAADEIMAAVWALVPEQERRRKEIRPEDELFTLDIEVFDSLGQPVAIPAHLSIADGSWISRFAHRPNLINTIRDYADLPVQVLKELDRKPPAEEIYRAAHSMLDYVEIKNPQYFNYRYGVEGGRAFQNSFRQLRDLMKWVMENGHRVEAELRHEYTDPRSGERCLLRLPQEVEQW